MGTAHSIFLNTAGERPGTGLERFPDTVVDCSRCRFLLLLGEITPEDEEFLIELCQETRITA